MSTRYVSVQQIRRQLPLLDRFKLRETRTKDVVREKKRPINPQPFQPYKSPTTGRWMPPRYSLRRQAQLGKMAFREGRFKELIKFISKSSILQSVKLEDMKQRIHELSNTNTVKIPVNGTLSASKAESELNKERKLNIMTAKEAKLDAQKKALTQAKALAMTRGPYSGRSHRNIFKGTRAEREAPRKKRQTAEKMSTMEKTIETWRKVSKNSWRCSTNQTLILSILFFNIRYEQKEGTNPDHLCHSRERVNCNINNTLARHVHHRDYILRRLYSVNDASSLWSIGKETSNKTGYF